MTRILPFGLAVAALASTAFGQSFTETFDNNSNVGGWTFGAPIETIQSSGGNPGWFLDEDGLDTFAPQLRTTGSGHPYVGDWRSRGVTSFGFDLITHSTQFPFAREATVILTSGNCSVYRLGTDFVPQVADGWKSFDIDVPTQSMTLPAGWTVQNPCGSDDQTWNTVITNVTEVRVFYGDPTFFFIFSIWECGLDNPRIVEGGFGTSYCGPAVANSTGVPAEIAVSGSDVAADNNFGLQATQVPQNQFGYFLTSQTQDFVQNPGGSQGNLCLGGQIGRFNVQVQNSGSAGAFSITVDLANIPTSPVHSVVAGETWNFQGWFRDDNPMPTSNFTDAISVLFQ